MTGERYEVHYKRPDGALIMPTRWRMLANAEWEAGIAAGNGLRVALVDRETKNVLAMLEPGERLPSVTQLP